MKENNTVSKVFKLKLELVEYDGSELDLTKEQKEILYKYGNFKNGFTREILVPANMSLRTLNYAIQKLYGWRNSHLHCFNFNKEDFIKLTDNMDKTKLAKLFGVCIRLDCENYPDLYSADNYNIRDNFKSWIRRKYSKNSDTLIVWETYFYNQSNVNEFNLNQNEFSTLLPHDIIEGIALEDIIAPKGEYYSIDEWNKLIDKEIARIDNLIVRSSKAALYYAENECDELIKDRETKSNIESLMNELIGEDDEGYEEIIDRKQYNRYAMDYEYYKKSISKREKKLKEIIGTFVPKMYPITDNLLYSYDYGEGWQVKVTLEEVINIDNEKIEDLEESLKKVVEKHVPVCISLDGHFLLDDIGGINGFINMLSIINDKNNPENEDYKNFVKYMGWSEKIGPVDKIL